jgi:ATP diphosphatase
MADKINSTAALISVMAALRDPQTGCPWDKAQDFATIAPYTIEEAYEVRAAIRANDPGQIKDELGDLLFQVVYHARLAEERGWFDFNDVAAAITDKMIRRHPHVFWHCRKPAGNGDGGQTHRACRARRVRLAEPG